MRAWILYPIIALSLCAVFLLVRGCGGLPFPTSTESESTETKTLLPIELRTGPIAPINSQMVSVRPRSVGEFVNWLRNEAAFQYDRTGNYPHGRFTLDKGAVDKFGFSLKATDSIMAQFRVHFGIILRLAWERKPDKIEYHDFRTVCEYGPGKAVTGEKLNEQMEHDIRGPFTTFMEIALQKEYDVDYLDFSLNLAEALLQVLREEPMTRELDQARFVATIEDVVSDGRNHYHITEQLLNQAGEITWTNELISEVIPAPYKKFLKSEE